MTTETKLTAIERAVFKADELESVGEGFNIYAVGTLPDENECDIQTVTLASLRLANACIEFVRDLQGRNLPPYVIEYDGVFVPSVNVDELVALAARIEAASR